MKRMVIRAGSVLAITAGCLIGCSKEAPRSPVTPVTSSNQAGEIPNGEQLFKQFCSSCHPDGGNVSDPDRSLRGSALQKNHIAKPDDIVRIMRKPQSRMIRFDESTISDRDARALAEYVLKAFR
ncbi:MAG TPA: c-type cytochrome [Desulfuromonadales bacterium]|nr:c-type cytochrome [Desulfuromonadales bacterium]